MKSNVSNLLATKGPIIHVKVKAAHHTCGDAHCFSGGCIKTCAL